MSEPSPPPSSVIFAWQPLVILTSVILASLLPFVGKAFHIDDPVFIWIARQIQANPADFFVFTINRRLCNSYVGVG